MRRLLLLQPVLLTLFATSCAHDDGRGLHEYNPDHVAIVKRQLDAQRQLAWQAPYGLRKMSDDGGEKFWLHDWKFAADLTEEEVVLNWTVPLTSPLAPHASEADMLPAGVGLFRRTLEQRDFKCPLNTFSCANNSEACCPTGDTCVTVSGGGIGCCAAGQNCDNAVVSDCDTGAGYTECESAGGGCCIPGSNCVTGGCLISATETITYTAPVVTVTSGAVSSTVTSGHTTVVAATPSSTSAATCSSGSTACPESLGGNCCPSGYGCIRNGCSCTSDCTTPVSSPTVGPPIAPTSVTGQSTPTATATSTVVGGCPTGFYMCSAYYLGGCCRVDRSCHTLSCPPTASTTIVSSGETVVVPYTSTSTVTGSDTVTVTSGTSGTGDSCASGWYSCPASASGGCCLSGFICGTQSCMATGSGQNDTPKIAPSKANVATFAWTFFCFAVGAAVGMIML